MKSNLPQFSNKEIDQLIEIAGGLPEQVNRDYFTEVLSNSAAKPSYICICYSLRCMEKQTETLGDLKRIVKATKCLTEDLNTEVVSYILEKTASKIYSKNPVHEIERILTPILDASDNLKELHNLAVQAVSLKTKVSTTEQTGENNGKRYDGDPIILSAVQSLLDIWCNVLDLKSGMSVDPYTNKTDGPIIQFILKYLEILKVKIPDSLLSKCQPLQKSLDLSENAFGRKYDTALISMTKFILISP